MNAHVGILGEQEFKELFLPAQGKLLNYSPLVISFHVKYVVAGTCRHNTLNLERERECVCVCVCVFPTTKVIIIPYFFKKNNK